MSFHLEINIEIWTPELAVYSRPENFSKKET